ncbi:MAG: hypothetical protein ABEK50_13825 [bacterium]
MATDLTRTSSNTIELFTVDEQKKDEFVNQALEELSPTQSLRILTNREPERIRESWNYDNLELNIQYLKDSNYIGLYSVWITKKK